MAGSDSKPLNFRMCVITTCRSFACVVAFLASYSAAFSQCSTDGLHEGTFSGPIVAKWLQHEGDDRDMIIMQDVTFSDGCGTKWTVPEGAKVNGASIPRVLWSPFGSPFVGDYRRASVIHDHFCRTKEEPSQSVHRMFYNAARTDGVSRFTANSLYAAVRALGPRWITITGFDGISKVIELRPSMSEEQLKQVLEWVGSENPTLDEIDARIESYESENP